MLRHVTLQSNRRGDHKKEVERKVTEDDAPSFLYNDLCWLCCDS